MNSWIGIAPLLTIALGAMLTMLAEAFGKSKVHVEGGEASIDPGAGRQAEMGLLTAVILFAAAVVSLGLMVAGPKYVLQQALAPYFIADGFTQFMSFVVCVAGGIASLVAGGYLTEHRIDRSEFFVLLQLSTVGALALVAAGDLLSLFVALETMSLGVYCLVGLRRTPRALEAALKYFLLGSFAAAVLLFGGALLYGATGHTDLAGIGQAISHLHDGSRAGLVLVGAACVLAGLAFKVAAVPFHAWTPDAYEGAVTPATGFMAAVVKTAAFAVLLRVLLVALGDEGLASWGTGWPPLLAVVAVATMSVANLVAGRQSSVKRMLAYSSIAHAGYALVGVVAMLRSADGQASVMMYLFVYSVSTLGAFGALALCGSYGREAVSYQDLAGLGKRHPAIALAFSLFLLSLAGIPPTAGFFGKLFVFRAAMESDLTLLVVIALINSVVGAYYYLRVLVYMYMREPEPEAPVAVPMRSSMIGVALVIAAVFILALGLLPNGALGALTKVAL